MKKKEVEIDGHKYVIASLTVDQVEHFWPALSGGEDVQEGPKKKVFREFFCPVVAASLNNALTGNGRWWPQWPPAEFVEQGKGYSPEGLVSDLSYDEVWRLYQEITTFSGLKTKTPTEPAPTQPGETKATAPTVN